MSTRALTPSLAAPVPAITPVRGTVLQRTCDCGQHSVGGAECEECKKKKKILSRSSDGSEGPSIAPPIVHAALHSPGQPLDVASRAFFEPRFGRDLSHVRVHTDDVAAQSAAAVRAQAYAVGNSVVFGRGHYSPETPSGRSLLAHELTHVVQQSSAGPGGLQRNLPVGQPGDAAEQEADAVARAVLSETPCLARQASRIPAALSRKEDKKAVDVPNKKIDDLMKQIHKKLTSFFFNVFVSEKDVHEVLLLLKPLPESDLSEAVERMEREGLVDRLFKHVSDADKEQEAGTLQRIQNSRVQLVKTDGGATVTVQGSCSLADNQAIAGKVNTTKEWAKKAKSAVSDFASDPAKNGGTGTLLDKYFFHQATNPPGIPEAQQKTKAAAIRDNFEKVEQQVNALPNVCASPVDTQCEALAAAYVPADRSAVMFCRSFFTSDAQSQTYMLFHELTHVYAGVSDRGYGDERVFAHLSPDSSIDNADSYALFATDTSGVAGGAGKVRGPAPQDKIADCDPEQKKTVEHAFAFGSRMVTRALGALGQSDPASLALRQGWLNANFKTTDPEKLGKVRERFHQIKDKLAGSINFECEKSCKANVATYYYKLFGTTVHICPPFFSESDEDRTGTLLAGVVGEELGLKHTALAGTPAFARQSADEAIDNANSYAAYAQDVTKRWGI